MGPYSVRQMYGSVCMRMCPAVRRLLRASLITRSCSVRKLAARSMSQTTQTSSCPGNSANWAPPAAKRPSTHSMTDTHVMRRFQCGRAIGAPGTQHETIVINVQTEMENQVFDASKMSWRCTDLLIFSGCFEIHIQKEVCHSGASERSSSPNTKYTNLDRPIESCKYALVVLHRSGTVPLKIDGI
ncbi:hypothetical protein HYDPIDRAFT_116434 [Hydnomerulius pinastri MD-312]|uniref:Uncharacterized protein n=1 Tax=Hydnomerulius pinastri MD-312 TaxID=994086 RepID=A0A0C9V6B2_9AGAM|nr:hypothetical protein HYDPIDRAFT_116434 [Hydnomerulius pinastri MD-312]